MCKPGQTYHVVPPSFSRKFIHYKFDNHWCNIGISRNYEVYIIVHCRKWRILRQFNLYNWKTLIFSINYNRKFVSFGIFRVCTFEDPLKMFDGGKYLVWSCDNQVLDTRGTVLHLPSAKWKNVYLQKIHFI